MSPFQTIMWVGFSILSISVFWTTAPMSRRECMANCKRCWNSDKKCRGFPEWKGDEPPCDAEWIGSVCRCHVKCPFVARKCIPLNACKVSAMGKFIPQMICNNCTTAPPAVKKTRAPKVTTQTNNESITTVKPGDVRQGRGFQIESVLQEPVVIIDLEEKPILHRNGETQILEPEEKTVLRRSNEVEILEPEKLSKREDNVLERIDAIDSAESDSSLLMDITNVLPRSVSDNLEEPE